MDKYTFYLILQVKRQSYDHKNKATTQQ